MILILRLRIGLDDENHYSTAYDLAMIAKEVLKNEYLSGIVSKKSVEIHINGNSRILNSTNEMLTYYDGANGVKTGFTGNAGRCIVTSANRNGRQLISVILGCDSKKNRTVDSIRLLDFGFNMFQIVDLSQLIKQEMTISVDKSEHKTYKIVKNIGAINYPLKEGENAHISVEYSINENLVAPLNKGIKVGRATIKLNDIAIKEIRYNLPEKISRKHWIEYFIKT